MNWTIPLRSLAAVALFTAGLSQVDAQDCQNSSQYPSTVITPNNMGALTSISSCSYFGEYSVVGPVVPSGEYQFKISGGGYITVREGAVGGPVIAQGVSPVTATATVLGNLYVHWNANADCGTSNSCKTTSVQFMLNCTPPAATFTSVDDCPNNQFSINVNVTSLGDGASVDLIYSANGGAPQTTAGVGTGVTTIGPFTVGQTVDVTVVHASDPMCNRYYTGLESNNTCPVILECGGAPIDGSYCYVNNDNNNWRYECDCGMPVIIIFSAGSIESSSWDHLRIYDGNSNTGPLLWQNGTGSTNLAGLQVIAQSGNLYMENTSDGSGSCQSGSYTTWVWQVGCLDCTMPVATYNVVTDCDSMQYHVEVNISELGSDPVLDITNNNGALPAVATGPGTYTVGPFPAGSTTIVSLENDVNPLCSVSSQPLTNPLCPTIVNCGGASVQETYCYTNYDTMSWRWQASGNQPLAIQFAQGQLEGGTWDKLRIYDGINNTAPLIFNSVGPPVTSNLAGLLRIAGPNIYMEMTSDVSGSCQGSNYTPWAWEVGCLDCTNPGATFSVVEDCVHRTFSVAVNVDSLGSGSFVRIGNSYNTDTLTNVPTGITMVGPFPMDSLVTIVVLNETNNLCRTFSTPLTLAVSDCVQEACAATATEYCYTNADTAWFAYQGTPGLPLTIEFLWGKLLVGDFVQIYNGLDTLEANRRWQGNANGDLTGLAINTTGLLKDKLLLRIISNGSGSCETGQIWPPLHWVVQCGMVGVEEQGKNSFSMFPNPTTGELSVLMPDQFNGTAQMRISDLAGRTVFNESFIGQGTTKNFQLDLQTGNYIVTITTLDWVTSQQLQIIR